ncbi:MAG: 2-amino-4-hydroxy-6-hydroxymethyldihydropteridine diphosphokinase [Solirubrobacterales bacterium]
MPTAYLGLGSNVGDPPTNLARAVELLRSRGLTVESVSSGYSTQPVGEILDQPDFLNAVVAVDTDLGPEELLDLVKSIEAEMGRETGLPRHSPRIIDIDLLLLGDTEHESDRLSLPHREVSTRRFVLVPLLEIAPDLTLPDGSPVADLLAALEDEPDQAVKPAGPLPLP